MTPLLLLLLVELLYCAKLDLQQQQQGVSA
jgi:hypothetical protein